MLDIWFLLLRLVQVETFYNRMDTYSSVELTSILSCNHVDSISCRFSNFPTLKVLTTQNFESFDACILKSWYYSSLRFATPYGRTYAGWHQKMSRTLSLPHFWTSVDFDHWAVKRRSTALLKNICWEKPRAEIRYEGAKDKSMLEELAFG